MAKKKNVQKRPAINSAKVKSDALEEKLNVEEIITNTEAETSNVEELKTTNVELENSNMETIETEESMEMMLDDEKKAKKAMKKAERESIGQKIRGTKQEISKINWGEPKQVRTTLGAVIAYSIIGAIVMLVTTQIAIKVAEAINAGMIPKAN
jgi:preprotein translocase subunit SecE